MTESTSGGRRRLLTANMCHLNIKLGNLLVDSLCFYLIYLFLPNCSLNRLFFFLKTRELVKAITDADVL